MKTLKTLSILALGAAISLSSCKKEDAMKPSASSQQNQSFKVRMTDNPGNYERLDVEIESVTAFNSTTNQWIELNGNAQMVSVLELTNGKEKQLAFKGDVEAGIYTKLKIEFSQNNQLTINAMASGGTSESVLNLGLNVGATSTISETVILDINEEVSVNSSANILLDFDVAESVEEEAGSYILDPKLLVITDEKTGAQGSIQGDIRAALKFDLNGDLFVDYSAYTNEEGDFLLRGMVDGTYTVTVMPDQEEGANLEASYTINNVVVVDGQITQLGEISLN